MLPTNVMYLVSSCTYVFAFTLESMRAETQNVSCRDIIIRCRVAIEQLQIGKASEAIHRRRAQNITAHGKWLTVEKDMGSENRIVITVEHVSLDRYFSTYS